MEKQNETAFQLKSKHTSLCFFILIEIMYGFSFTPLDFTGILHDVLLYSALFMAAMSLLLRHRWNAMLLLKVCITLGTGVLVYVLANETLFLIMMLATLLAGDVGYPKILKSIFFVRLSMLFIVLLSTAVGIFPVGLVVVTKGAFGTEIAYSLGYTHPNGLGQEIYFLCSLYVCFRNNKIKKSEILVILILDLVAYFVTKSKTACILTAMMVLFAWFYQSIKNVIEKNKKILTRLLLGVGVLFPIASIGGSYAYTNATGKLRYVLYYLNTILNGRLSNGSIMFVRFPLKLFGMQIDLSSLSRFYSYFIVDNGYIFSLFNFGLIPFTLLVFMYLYSLLRLMKGGNYIYAANLFLFLMCVVSENIMRAMFVNFSVIFCYEIYAEDTILDKAIQTAMGGKYGRKKNSLLLVWRK